MNTITKELYSISSKPGLADDGLRNNWGIITFNQSTDFQLLDFKGILEYPEIRKHWDNAFDNAKMLRVMHEYCYLAHSKTRSFWPVQARDLVLTMEFIKKCHSPANSEQTLQEVVDSLEEYGFMVYMKSCDNDSSIVPHQPGYTRAFLHWNSFEVFKDPNTGQVCIELKVKSDPKGSIPLKILQILGDLVPKNLEQIFAYYLKKGPPPCIVHSLFNGVRMDDVEWREELNCLDLHYTEASPGYCISVIRVSPMWLKNLECSAVNVEVANGVQYVNVEWQLYNQNVYIKLDISNSVSVKISPAKSSRENSVLLNGEEQTPCPSMMQKFLGTPDNNAVSSSPSASNNRQNTQQQRLLGSASPKRMSANLARSVVYEQFRQQLQMYPEYMNILRNHPASKGNLQTTVIPQAEHPSGVIHGSRLFEVPNGYSLEEYVDTLIASINSSYSRAKWDEVFDHGKTVTCVPIEEHEKLHQLEYEPYSHYLRVVKTLSKAIWPVAPRYLIVLISMLKKRDSYIIIASSIPKEFTKMISPNLESDQHVRATLDFGQWTFKPVNGKVEISYTIKTKPNGSIPAFLLQRMAHTFPAAINNVVSFHSKNGSHPFFIDSPWISSYENGKFTFVLNDSAIEEPLEDVYYGPLVIDKKWAKNRIVSIVCDDVNARFTVQKQSAMITEIIVDNCVRFQVHLTMNKHTNEYTMIQVNGQNIQNEVVQKKESVSDFDLPPDQLEMLIKATSLFHEIMNSSSEKRRGKRWTIHSEEIDLDSNLIESQLSHVDFLVSHLGFKKRLSSAMVDTTPFPCLYKITINKSTLFSSSSNQDQYVLFKKKITGNKSTKSILILFSNVRFSEYLAVILENRDSYLTRKSYVTIYNKIPTISVPSLFDDLKKCSGMYFRTLSAFGMIDHTEFDFLAVKHEMIHEVECKCDDAIIYANGGRWKFVVHVLDGQGEIIIPQTHSSCEVLLDSSDPRVSLITPRLNIGSWIVNGKLTKHWILSFDKLLKGMIVEVSVEYRNRGSGVLINGVRKTPDEAEAIRDEPSAAMQMAGSVAISFILFALVSVLINKILLL